MKKIVFLLVMGVFALISEVSAQIAPVATTIDTLAYKEYVGKYKVKEGPVEELIVSIQDGKLMGEAVGQGSAQLIPKKELDIFEVMGYDGTLEFIRNESRMVIKIKLTVQGTSMEGEKMQ